MTIQGAVNLNGSFLPARLPENILQNRSRNEYIGINSNDSNFCYKRLSLLRTQWA